MRLAARKFDRVFQLDSAKVERIAVLVEPVYPDRGAVARHYFGVIGFKSDRREQWRFGRLGGGLGGRFGRGSLGGLGGGHRLMRGHGKAMRRVVRFEVQRILAV